MLETIPLATLDLPPVEAALAALEVDGGWERFGVLDALPGGEEPLGVFVNPDWWRGVEAFWLADATNYPKGTRVEFDRLAFTMSRFAQGFRLYLGFRAGRWWPVAYTAWHPVSPLVFAWLDTTPREADPEALQAVPLGDQPFLYLFNYSARRELRGTALTRVLMQNYAAEIAAVAPAGLCALTVSDDGARVARRFGMTARQRWWKDGCPWELWVGRR
jgi:hypothetical protein